MTQDLSGGEAASHAPLSERAATESATILANARHAVFACYLGWTLDAFDFFIMVFVLDDVARSFGVPIQSTAFAITLTLACRMIGALIFGRLADRFGRRPTMIANVVSYATLELLSGCAPGITSFLVLRALYGVAMGGEWGVGASLAMESVPARWRGMVSGLLQSGYPSGYLLASLLFLAEPVLGWRGMFIVGALPALLVFYIRRNVPESPDWQVQETRGAHDEGVGVLLRRHGLLALYGIVLMTCFNFFSHGSQDLYPKLFLVGQHHLSHGTVTAIMIVYNLGAMAGGLLFGWLSQRLGRRWTMAIAALLALPAIPLWAFSHGAALLCLGGFLIQLCVQGAWGVVPAYLNEISPPALRATFPGTVYQLGNLIAACNANLQLHIAAAFGDDLRWAMAGVVGTVAVVIAILAIAGRETRQVLMGRELSRA